MSTNMSAKIFRSNRTKLFLVLPAVLLLAVACGSGASSNQAAAPAPAPQAMSNNTATSTPTKLTDEPYYKYAYEIDPKGLGSLSPLMKQVLSGFTVTSKNNSDGTVTVDLKANKDEYHNQSYTLKSGEKLYFIERSLGDDNGDTDNFMGDDTSVVVDANGYVVQ